VQQLAAWHSKRERTERKLSGNQLNADQGQLSVHPLYLLVRFFSTLSGTPNKAKWSILLVGRVQLIKCETLAADKQTLSGEHEKNTKLIAMLEKHMTQN
jgi:hypothetical protein